MDIVCLECVEGVRIRKKVEDGSWSNAVGFPLQCKTTHIVNYTDDGDEMSSALCPSLAPKSYLSSRRQRSAPSLLFCSAEKLNDLLRGEQSTVRT